MNSSAASTALADAVTAAVRHAIGPHEGLVPLHAPTLAGNAWDYVRQCIDTGWISSAGAFVTQFEQKITELTGAAHAVATVNGTAALHIALMLVGVEAGDEVICPSLTFVATANAIAYLGAVPHFVDVEPDHLGIDIPRVAAHLGRTIERRDGACFNRRTGRRIAAIVPMHTFGHPVDLDALVELAGGYDLPIVEDAAESLGSLYHDRHTGTFGRVGILSFNGNKIISTGGGGMIITDDDALSAQARHLTTTAKAPHAWEYFHDRVGYNYRLPNINAALGVAQLEQLPDLLSRKHRLAQRYAKVFADTPGVRFIADTPRTRPNHWLNAIVLDEPEARDAVLAALAEAQFQARPVWQPMHQLPMYDQCPGMDLGTTEAMARRVINLPSSAHLVD
jgi:perosamine synthetase